MIKVYFWTIFIAFGATLTGGGGTLASFTNMFVDINFLFGFLIVGRAVFRFIYFKYLMDKDLYDKLGCCEEFYKDLRAWEQKQ